MTSSQQCEECGFAYEPAAFAGAPARIDAAVARFVGLLGPRTTALRARRDARAWSALEYACHVRDVLLAQRERLFLILVEDEPVLTSIHRDERAVLARYADDEPGRVSAELETAAALFGRAVASLTPEQAARTCVANFYNDPPGTVRSLAWLVVHTAHECTHHLGDARRALEVVGEAGPAPH